MDIIEIKNLKRSGELEIRSILRNIEELTKCSIYDVNIILEQPIGSENGMVVDVSIKIQV